MQSHWTRQIGLHRIVFKVCRKYGECREGTGSNDMKREGWKVDGVRRGLVCFWLKFLHFETELGITCQQHQTAKCIFIKPYSARYKTLEQMLKLDANETMKKAYSCPLVNDYL